MLGTTILLISGITSGCDMFSGKSNAQKSLEKLKTKLIKKENRKDKKAFKTAHSNYTYAQKEIFLDRKKNELADIEQELNQLVEKVDTSKNEVKVEAKKRLNAFRVELKQTKTNIEKVENADESKWEAAKTSFNTTNSNLKGSLAEISQWLSDKIEP